MDNEKWMNIALGKAKEALDAQEVAVGCIFIKDGEIVASGRNTVNETRNPTRHAELDCIDQVLAHCKKNNLNSSEFFRSVRVFVTVEPCVMCAEALHYSGVSEVIYGCRNDRFGGTTVIDLSMIRTPSYMETGGVLPDAAMDLLKKFYAGSNPNAPVDKTPKSKRKKRSEDM